MELILFSADAIVCGRCHGKYAWSARHFCLWNIRSKFIICVGSNELIGCSDIGGLHKAIVFGDQKKTIDGIKLNFTLEDYGFSVWSRVHWNGFPRYEYTFWLFVRVF